MKPNTIITGEHHRRSRSVGGQDIASNISYVKLSDHKHWHTLFGNMNAYQICNQLNVLQIEKGVTVICKFINGHEVEKSATEDHSSKNPSKIRKAWNGLFGSKTFREAIDCINSTWIDPSYHLYLV